MLVTFLQNTIYKHRRYRAGDSAEVEDAVAKQMFAMDLAYAQKPIAAPTAEEPAKAPTKRATRKAVTK